MKSFLAGFVFGLLSSGCSTWASPPTAADLDLDPDSVKNSPALQRWLKTVPDVAAEIQNDPSFRTRIRAGFISSDRALGINLGIEDLRIKQTPLTVSADYQAAFNGRHTSWGADLHYYTRPLGSYLNIAPVVGYRHLKIQDDTNRVTIDGVNLGVRVLWVPSRGGGADISLTQSWVSPFSTEQTGLTRLSFGYALTHNLRLATDFQKQNSPIRKDSRVGISLEWMP